MATDDALDSAFGYDEKTNSIRSMKSATKHYREQPYMADLRAIQQVLIDTNNVAVSVVKHTRQCRGVTSDGEQDCDCLPIINLKFPNIRSTKVYGVDYMYHSQEDGEEQRLRDWLKWRGY